MKITDQMVEAAVRAMVETPPNERYDERDGKTILVRNMRQTAYAALEAALSTLPHIEGEKETPPPETQMTGGENRLISMLRVEAGTFAIMNEKYTARAINKVIADFEASFPTAEHQSSGLLFPIGSRVRKKKGSSWQGVVVGTYSTKLTPIGYAVESEREPGSVQIYPEAALAALTTEGQP